MDVGKGSIITKDCKLPLGTCILTSWHQ